MNHKKHYVVKSRIRFFISVLLLMLITVTAFNTLLGFNNAEGETKDQYTMVEVCSGDTIWDIAKAHLTDQEDLRQTVYQIMAINHISAGNLQPGQLLKIPV